MGSDTSTLTSVEPDPTAGRRRLMRSITLGLFTLFVLFGLTGGLGVRTAHKTATGDDGLLVELSYPRVTRPALAVLFEVEVSRPSGFTGQIEVDISSSYLATFDENGTSPEPVEDTDDGEVTTWMFDPPPGDTLVLSLDTRVEPGVQWRRKGEVTVRADGAEATVTFTTWISP